MAVQTFMACFACIMQIFQTGFNILDEHCRDFPFLLKLVIYTPLLTQIILKNPEKSDQIALKKRLFGQLRITLPILQQNQIKT